MKKLIALASLIIFELIMFILILFVPNNHTYILCYVSVIAVFLVALIYAFFKKEYLIPTALLFTLIADLFLVLIGAAEVRVYGMFFFMIVQFIYGYYLLINDKDHLKISIIIRLVINVILITAGILVLKDNTDFLSMFSVIYLANIISNIIACFLNLKKYYLLLIGLFLFLLCDVYTGLVIADGTYLTYKEGGILYSLVNANFNFTWFFYIPSQTIIAIYYINLKK